MREMFAWGFALTLALSASVASAGEWHTSYGKALAETKTTGKPLLVVLEPAAQPAAGVQQTSLRTSTLAADDALLGKYVLCSVDTTSDYGQKVAAAFAAQELPHVAIIDKTGSYQIFRRSGAMTTAELNTALNAHQQGVVRRVSRTTTTYDESYPVMPSYTPPTFRSYCPNCR